MSDSKVYTIQEKADAIQKWIESAVTPDQITVLRNMVNDLVEKRYPEPENRAIIDNLKLSIYDREDKIIFR